MEAGKMKKTKTSEKNIYKWEDGRYFLQIRKRGDQPFSKTFYKFESARKLKIRILHDMEEGSYSVDKYRPSDQRIERTFSTSELLEEFLEVRAITMSKCWKNEKSYLQWIIPILGDYPIDDFPSFMLEKFRSQFRETKISYGKTPSNCYVNNVFGFLRTAFKYAVERGYISKNPITGLKKLKRGKRHLVFSDEERARLLDGCKASNSEQLFDFILLLLQTGLRLNEAKHVRARDIDFIKRSIHIQRPKVDGKDTVYFPSLGELDNVLRSLVNNSLSKDWLLFRSSDDQPFKPKCMRTALRTVLKNQNIPSGKLFHCCRHDFVTRLIKSGEWEGKRLNPSLAQLLTRHSSAEMVEHYSHLNEEKMGPDISNTIPLFDTNDEFEKSMPTKPEVVATKELGISDEVARLIQWKLDGHVSGDEFETLKRRILIERL
jgi:integrase